MGRNLSEIFIETYTFSFNKMHLKLSSGKWRPSCPGLNVLRCVKTPATQMFHSDSLFSLIKTKIPELPIIGLHMCVCIRYGVGAPLAGKFPSKRPVMRKSLSYDIKCSDLKNYLTIKLPEFAPKTNLNQVLMTMVIFLVNRASEPYGMCYFELAPIFVSKSQRSITDRTYTGGFGDAERRWR